MFFFLFRRTRDSMAFEHTAANHCIHQNFNVIVTVLTTKTSRLTCAACLLAAVQMKRKRRQTAITTCSRHCIIQSSASRRPASTFIPNCVVVIYFSLSSSFIRSLFVGFLNIFFPQAIRRIVRVSVSIRFCVVFFCLFYGQYRQWKRYRLI